MLNGLFGVRKHTPEGKQVLYKGVMRDRQRLIMNLVPGNSLQAAILGDQEDLPYVGQWSALHLLGEEIFLGSERDRMCYFYCYKLPRSWGGAMTLATKVPGWRVKCP